MEVCTLRDVNDNCAELLPSLALCNIYTNLKTSFYFGPHHFEFWYIIEEAISLLFLGNLDLSLNLCILSFETWQR